MPRPSGQFSGRFILVILGLVIAYMLAMWFAWAAPADAAMIEAGRDSPAR